MFSDPYFNVDKLDLDLGMKVVDVGAGSGHYTIIIAEKIGSTGKVYAVDVQKDLLARLRKEASEVHLHNIEIVLGNAEKLGGTRLKDGVADRVFVSNVLFQIDDKDNFVLEMKRLLRSGGKLVLVDWSTGVGVGPHTQMVVGPLEAAHLFMNAGFTKLEEFDAGDHHYGIILKKP